MSTPSRRLRPLGLLFLVVAVVLAAAPAVADEATPVVVTSAPTISGDARHDSVLTATPGTWDAADVTTSYAWLRDGRVIAGATGASYRLVAADAGRRIAVRVVASAPGRTSGEAESEATAAVGPKLLGVSKRPTITGSRRFGTTLVAKPGSWSVSGLTFSYQWLRDGRPIAGARKNRYAIAPGDVGDRLSVEVTATRALHATRVVASARTSEVKHRRDVKRTITYRVTRNGSKASLATFRKQAAQTLADARGWRGGGIRFKEVTKGGRFTLVLAKASRVRSYSRACSATWSCRVGRNVIINEARWDKASPAWNKAKGSLRDYRHMVVNHEVGHFLGKGHARCGGKGRTAPVMQQQSKGLQGCRFNPWPTVGELKGL